MSYDDPKYKRDNFKRLGPVGRHEATVHFTNDGKQTNHMNVNQQQLDDMEKAMLGPVLSRSEVDTVLCIFDEVLGCYLASCDPHTENNLDENQRYWGKVQEEGGTPALRDMSRTLAPVIDAAWHGIDEKEREEFCITFDFEFVPAMLSKAVNMARRIASPPTVYAQDVWNFIAVEVMKEFAEEFKKRHPK